MASDLALPPPTQREVKEKQDKEEKPPKKIAHFQLEDETEVEFLEDEDEETGETHMHLSVLERVEGDPGDPSQTRKKEREEKIKKYNSFVKIYEDLTGQKAPKEVKDAEKRRKKGCETPGEEEGGPGQAVVKEEKSNLDTSGDGNGRSLSYCYNWWWEQNYCDGNEAVVKHCQCYSCKQGYGVSSTNWSTDFYTTAYAHRGDIQQRYYRWVDPWWRTGYWKRMSTVDIRQGYRRWAWAKCYGKTKWHAKIYGADSNDEYYWFVKWTNDACKYLQTPGWMCDNKYVY